MPKAVDANIVVRLFVDDGSKEVPIARAVFKREVVEISLTVILECAWALRSAYKFKRAEICTALDALLSLPNVIVPQYDLVAEAVDAHRKGVDFADACLLLSAENAEEVLTFDEIFEKRAKRLANVIPVRIPTITS